MTVLKTNIISVDSLRELIKGTQPDPTKKGHAFTVTFVKSNGETRVMRARLGMKRGLTGKGQSFDPVAHGLQTVWECGNGYRNIRLEAVKSLRLPDGSKHLVEAIRPGTYIARGAFA
jgi:hypothetical protein